MAMYIVMNNDIIATDIEKVFKSAPALGANNGKIFSLKAYVDNGNSGICRIVLAHNLNFNEAVESINRVFAYRVEVWNQILNRPVVRSIEKRETFNRREQYISSKVVNHSSENYVQRR